ncbi:MAG: pitrilysin family protein [Pyrinomonadaceae bacterium]
MKYDFNFLIKPVVLILGLFLLVACGAVAVAYAQSASEPTRREHLLNGLKLLIWVEPKNPDVTIKLRIHSGGAFDPKGKEGVAALLADSMFPGEQTKLFFEEELGGELKVESNQDFIEITARGRADNFERMLDTVRNGVLNLPLTPENFKKIQAARVKMIEAESLNLSKLADDAVRKRLFGEFFPYGRSTEGTPESLQKIDRVDLIQARDRFLSSDNATLAILGNVDPKFAVKAVKQFFGTWSKADKLVPTTFRQPDAPDKQVLIIKKPSVERAEIRFALRGAARNSADFAAVQIAAQIMQERWQKSLPQELRQNAFVRHEPHVLPGIVVFGASVEGGFAETYLKTAQETFAKILSEPLSADEFNRAKTVVSNDINQTSGAGVEEKWFDADTFKLGASYNQNNALSIVSVAQTETVIANWQKQTPAAVAITQAEGNQIAPNQD